MSNSNNIYMGTIDAGGDGKTLLLAAINRELNKNYKLEDFEFSAPALVTVPDPQYNSVIKFGPKLTAGYYGVRSVFYNRIHASQLGQIIVAYDGEGYLIQLLDKINEKYGILITEADIVNKAITPPSGGVNQVNVSLEFKDTSIVFYSSAMIQIGLNDPSGDTTPVLPFENYATFAFDQSQKFELLGSNYAIIEPFSLALGRDNRTLRLSTLATAMQGTGVGAHGRVRLPQANYDARRKQLPFVAQWVDNSSSRSRGVSVLGDVYELSSDGFDWTLIGNGLGLSTTDPDLASAGFATPYVKAAAQAANGDVYVLAKKPGEAPAIWKIAANTGVWSKLGITPGRMQCLDTARWSELQALDILHSNNRLWVLIRTNTSYDVHPTKGLTTPSVEVFNTTSLTTDYYPLGQTLARFSDIPFATTTGKWRLVTPPNAVSASHCDVVALLNSSVSNNTYAVLYRHQAAAEYQAFILPSTSLPNSTAARSEMDICAYQIDLNVLQATANNTTVAGAYLDVVAILAPVEVTDFNRYFLRTGVRSPEKYLAYGVHAFTSVAIRTARTPWKENKLSLGSANAPSMVTLYGAGQRNHVVFQNGTAVHRLTFSQIVDTTVFEARLDSTTRLETHTGFAGVAPVGSCVYVRPGMSEFATPVAALAVIQDDEATLAPIGYSFITKTTLGVRGWYTAQTASDLLAARTPSANYAFMGKVPAVVLAEGNRIMFWSAAGNGLFVTTNGGNKWQEFNAAPFFYRQEAPASVSLSILGSATLRLTAENFNEAAFVGNKVLIETNVGQAVLTYDVNAQGFNVSKTLTDQMLYEVGPASGGNAYVASGKQSGFGLNALGQYSPRKIFAWDSDANGVYETVGQFSSAPATPYNTDWRVTDYMYKLDGRLVDFSRDIRYLNMRHFLLVEKNNVWNLHFTDAVEPTKTVGLYGVADSVYTTFLPECNFHLWDYYDAPASYVPYVFYGGKRVLLLNRLKQDNTFDITQHVLTIPGDNGAALKPVKMYTANRRDYWFHQKGNGLFKLTYTYDGVANTSAIALVRVFDMSSAGLLDLEVQSGAIAGIAARNAPQEALLPDSLPNGYVIGFRCLGTTKVTRYADGAGGFYETNTNNSTDCGYVVASNFAPNQGTSGSSGS